MKLKRIPICGLNINAISNTDKLNGIISEGITKILLIMIVRIIDTNMLLRIMIVLGIEEKLLGKKSTKI